MVEIPSSLKHVQTCIVCGEHGNRVLITYDHLYPRALVRQPIALKPVRPFKPVIAAHTNIYPMCWRDHQIVDSGKIRALELDGQRNLNPVGLVKFIRDEYPLTPVSRLRGLQLRCMISVTGLFIRAVHSLNGELPRVLVARYHEATDEANELIAKLTTTLTTHC